jgi:hypothetical protein
MPHITSAGLLLEMTQHLSVRGQLSFAAGLREPANRLSEGKTTNIVP